MATPDRRASAGDVLAQTLLDAEHPVPFDELENAAPPAANVADVAGWVGNAVDEVGFGDRLRFRHCSTSLVNFGGNFSMGFRLKQVPNGLNRFVASETHIF